jgi:hypothetical protein
MTPIFLISFKKEVIRSNPVPFYISLYPLLWVKLIVDSVMGYFVYN